MTTHQKNAPLSIQLNCGIETTFYDLSEADRAFACKKAREIKAAKLPAKEHEAQAKADRDAVDEEQREAERRQRNQEAREAEELTMIEDFEPILCRNEFLDLPDNKPSNNFLRCQLIWLRRVGGDRNLSSGTFSNANKASMKKLVVEALDRWGQGAVAAKTPNHGDPDEIADVEMVDVGSDDVEDSGIESDVEDDADNYSFKPTGTFSPQTQLTSASRRGDSTSVLPRGRNPPPMTFGCRWDAENYSCSYDCVFTVFAWIYLHATPAWRDKWTQGSPMATLLSDHFERILSGLLGPTPDRIVPALFAEGRDVWRDLLFQRSATDFPRCGPIFASVSRVLEVLADDQRPSHYVTAILFCGTPGCPRKVKNLGARPYMLVSSDWSTAIGTTTPPHHESLETWIKNHYSSPHLTKTPDQCMRCQRPFSRRFIFLEPMWIWFEVFPQYLHVVIPALKITLGLVVLRLVAMIYYNGIHFRARLCDPSENWWFYDGQQNGGRPTPLSKITKEGELFQCGTGFGLTALVYCLANW